MKRHANVAVFVPHMGCPHTCSFCNQHSISGAKDAPSPDDVRRILSEGLETPLGKGGQAAFFGGSFTAIPEDYRLSLLEAAYPFIGDHGYSGIRISTRPDCIDRHVLGQLRQYGVRSIELGVQSMDAAVLGKNHRGHTPEDVAEASALIKEYGFELGHQMMTGLPGSSELSELFTASRLAEMKPDTMRIYPTLVFRETMLERWYLDGKYTPPSLEESVNTCAKLLLFFHERGISVIRMGLHGDPSLGGDVFAGPCHPAFKELCEGRIMLDTAIEKLKDGNMPKGKITIRVNPSAISKMTGQRKVNLEALARMGYTASVVPDGSVEGYDVRIEVPV